MRISIALPVQSFDLLWSEKMEAESLGFTGISVAVAVGSLDPSAVPSFARWLRHTEYAYYFDDNREVQVQYP